MHNTFFIGCTHFGHHNIITFKDDKGNLTRPFSSIEEHDETIIENCNKRIRKVDSLYLMGDVVIYRRCLPILERLNGKKKLLAGNHDIWKAKDYMKYFDNISAYRVYPAKEIIFSHIPIHPDSLEGRIKYNAHAHLHQRTIKDKKYINLCCEHTNYTPVELEEVLAMLKKDTK